MIQHWKGLELKTTIFEDHHDRTPSAESIPSQTSNLKHVDIIKVSGKPTYETSLERS